MEMIEKVERLREKADVTYEEAKAALEQSDGDLLDAMVLLERQGKVRKPAQSTFSTDYEEQTEYIRVRDKVEEQEQSAPSFGRTLGDIHCDQGRRCGIHNAHDRVCNSPVFLLGDTRPGHDHCSVLRGQIFI